MVIVTVRRPQASAFARVGIQRSMMLPFTAEPTSAATAAPVAGDEHPGAERDHARVDRDDADSRPAGRSPCGRGGDTRPRRRRALRRPARGRRRGDRSWRCRAGRCRPLGRRGRPTRASAAAERRSRLRARAHRAGDLPLGQVAPCSAAAASVLRPLCRRPPRDARPPACSASAGCRERAVARP